MESRDWLELEQESMGMYIHGSRGWSCSCDGREEMEGRRWIESEWSSESTSDES